MKEVYYEPRWCEAVISELTKTKIPTRILTDHQAFLVRQNKIELVGDKPEIVLN